MESWAFFPILNSIVKKKPLCNEFIKIAHLKKNILDSILLSRYRSIIQSAELTNEEEKYTIQLSGCYVIPYISVAF